MAMVQGSFQWIDVDPFGSPITFIDGALQALGRVGVLEVTATDTAALTDRLRRLVCAVMVTKASSICMRMMMQFVSYSGP